MSASNTNSIDYFNILITDSLEKGINVVGLVLWLIAFL